MKDQFIYDERLGIRLPQLSRDWADYAQDEQERILGEWEQIRGNIPERIKQMEAIINERQAQLNVEPVFREAVRLNSEIADYASRINDLHLLFRIDQQVEAGKQHR